MGTEVVGTVGLSGSPCGEDKALEPGVPAAKLVFRGFLETRPLSTPSSPIGRIELTPPFSAPASVIVNTFPAIVILATRLSIPVLGESVYLIVPLPMPDPELLVTQEVAAEVSQLQPVWVVTAMLPDPPAAGKEALEGDRV